MTVKKIKPVEVEGVRGYVDKNNVAWLNAEDVRPSNRLGGKIILAGKAYSSEQIHFFIDEHGAFACIPDKVNFKIKHDSELYKPRNIFENFSVNPELPPHLLSLQVDGNFN